METIVSPCNCCVRLAVAIVTLLTEGPSDSRGFTLTALHMAPPVPGRLQPRCVAVRVARSREPTPVTGVYSVPETIQAERRPSRKRNATRPPFTAVRPDTDVHNNTASTDKNCATIDDVVSSAVKCPVPNTPLNTLSSVPQEENSRSSGMTLQDNYNLHKATALDSLRQTTCSPCIERPPNCRGHAVLMGRNMGALNSEDASNPTGTVGETPVRYSYSRWQESRVCHDVSGCPVFWHVA
ncbi:hypothetical protein RRG08_008353 [Elysia crispata]|uniref:Uncharacterized protein n=1 Tax=Elysia crispata TaxID=231223 RepID=A0AAE0YVE3_9GAST|nr:hypothetical protein RRG08_008353 [Elysia crispata]